MARIILWNSIAQRRRSMSDTFYDNGLATLKGYLEDRGHDVEVIDWARDDFFQGLSPLFLAKLLRAIYAVMMATNNAPLRKVLGMLGLPLQALMSRIQDYRLRNRIEDFIAYVKQTGAHIVGVKMWYGQAFVNAQYLVRRLKEEIPDIIVMAGGYHDTLYEEHILNTCAFDLGAVCEGEFPLEKILSVIDKHALDWNKANALEEIVRLAEEGAIENLMYRKGQAIKKTARHELTAHSSKSIPRYSWQEGKVKIHVMVESLGCDWGQCNFCVHPYFYPHYSLRDPQEIVAEIKAMQEAGVGIFRFAGSDTPPLFGAKIGQKILEHKLRIIFGIGSRAQRGAKEKFESLVASYAILIRSGLRAVFMGGECGNDFINKEVMNKGVGFEDIVYSIKALREAEKKEGQKTYLSLALIYPPPLLGKVSLEQVKEDNMRLLGEALPDSVMITPPGPFLHTPWYENKQKFGFRLDDSLLERAMKYEYVLYKPPYLWPKLGISLDNKPFEVILSECGELRKDVEQALGIPTDISDEHFLMLYAAGMREKKEIIKAKQETMLDIVSCDYAYTNALAARVNAFSAAGAP